METVFFKDRRIGFRVSIPEYFQEVRKEEYQKLAISRDTLFMASVSEEASLSIVLSAFVNEMEFKNNVKANIDYLNEDKIEILSQEYHEINGHLACTIYLRDDKKTVRETLVLINDMLIIFSINMDHKNLIHDLNKLKEEEENILLDNILNSLYVFTPINPPLSLAQEYEESLEVEEEYEETKTLAEMMIQQDCLYKGITIPKFYFKYTYFKEDQVVMLNMINQELYFSGFKDEFLIIEKNQELENSFKALVEKHLTTLISLNLKEERPESNSFILFKDESNYVYIDLFNSKNDELKEFLNEFFALFKDKDLDGFEILPEALILKDGPLPEQKEESFIPVIEETEEKQEAVEEAVEEEASEEYEEPLVYDTFEESKTNVEDIIIDSKDLKAEMLSPLPLKLVEEKEIEAEELPEEIIPEAIKEYPTAQTDAFSPPEEHQEIYHFMAGAPIFRFKVPMNIKAKEERDFNVFDLLSEQDSFRVFLFPCKTKEIYENKVKDWMEKNISSADGLLKETVEPLVDGNEIKNYHLVNNRFYKIAYLSGYLIAISTDYSDENHLLIDYIIKKLEIIDSDENYTESFARKLRSLEILKAQGIDYLEELPLIRSSNEANKRSLDQVAKRAIALCVSTNFAVEVANSKSKRELRSSKKFFLKLLDNYRARPFLSPNEKKLFDSFDNNLAIQISWQFEALVILFWSLNLIEELPASNELVNPKFISSILSETNNYIDFINKTSLRSIEEILDLTDLVYRYDWYCVEKSSKGEEINPILNPEIILERHRALNWLITEDNWDEVDIST